MAPAGRWGQLRPLQVSGGPRAGVPAWGAAWAEHGVGPGWGSSWTGAGHPRGPCCCPSCPLGTGVGRHRRPRASWPAEVREGGPDLQPQLRADSGRI